MANNYFKTKSLKDIIPDESHGPALNRTLTASNLVALGVGAIIGTGIFTLTGTVAAEHTGPALVISFIIAGIGCGFAGLCYAEFAAMIPASGSAYTYSYATLGELVAWIIGWNLILEYLFGAATVAVGWSGYIKSFLHSVGVDLPDKLSEAPIAIQDGHWALTGNLINFPAVFIIGMMTALLVVGIQESAKFNNLIVLIKVAVVLLFIGFGMSYVETENWTPFIPENTTGQFGKFGWSGVMAGAGIIFFAYIGFDAVSTAAQEAKNPQRDMPIGILVSLAVCTVIYIVFTLVLTGLVKFHQLPETELGKAIGAPVAYAIDRTGAELNWLKPMIKVGAIAGLSSVALIMLMGMPRIFFTMAKDGLIPPVFAKVHPKYKTPHVATIVTGVIAGIIGGLLPIKILGELVSIGTLMAFVIVCIGIIILRKTRPDIPRPFKTPMVPLFPILGAIICGAQMYALPSDTWVRLLIWMILGFAIYFGYGAKNSKLLKG